MKDRKVYATEYTIENGAYISDNDCSLWWLRSPGRSSNDAAHVNYGGSIYCSGFYVDDDNVVVRPALWLEIE